MPQLSTKICHLLTPHVLTSLNSGGICEVLDFVTTDPEKITSSCGLSYKKVLAIRRVLLAQYSAFPINGLNLYDETINTVAVLPTGCSNLDEVLDCGIYTGEVTEITGVSVAGKTQFCKTLAINVAATLDQNVICIDTTGSWSVRRVAEILMTRFCDASLPSVLNRIRLCQCVVLTELQEVFEKIRIGLQCCEDSFHSSIKLIIVDSVAAVLSPQFFSGTYVEGLAMLQEFGRNLNLLAKEFAVAVVITNHVVSSSGTAPSGSDSYHVKPALGRCWTFVPSVRLLFQLLREPSQLPDSDVTNGPADYAHPIRAVVSKSTRNGTRFTTFKITKRGAENACQTLNVQHL